MKIIKIIPIIIILTIVNTTSYGQDCSEIKMNSSVNIIKKLKCKASNDGNVASEVSESSTTEEGEKKKGILSKLFKKPTWMK